LAVREQRIVDGSETRSESATSAGKDKIEFTVYGRPIPKGRPRLGNGRVYTPDRTKAWEQTIALVYKQKYHSFGFYNGEPLYAEVDAYYGVPKSTAKSVRLKMLSGEIRPTKRTGDADNVGKLAIDALNGLAYTDDAQIVEIVIRKFYGEPERTEIRVGRLNLEK